IFEEYSIKYAALDKEFATVMEGLPKEANQLVDVMQRLSAYFMIPKANPELLRLKLGQELLVVVAANCKISPQEVYLQHVEEYIKKQKALFKPTANDSLELVMQKLRKNGLI